MNIAWKGMLLFLLLLLLCLQGVKYLQIRRSQVELEADRNIPLIKGTLGAANQTLS